MSPEVDLQRFLARLRRDARQHVLLRRGNSARCARAGCRSRPRRSASLPLAGRSCSCVGEDAHARPGCSTTRRSDSPCRCAGAPTSGAMLLPDIQSRVELLQRLRQVRVRGVRAPVLGVRARVGLVVRDDVVARALEVLVDLRVEALLRAPSHRSPASTNSTNACAVRWMKSSAVASSGSMKPCESPTARQLRFQCFVTRPMCILRWRAWHVGIEQARGVSRSSRSASSGRAERRAVDVAVAVAVGERDLPRPAVLHRGRDGLRTGIGRRSAWASPPPRR